MGEVVEVGRDNKRLKIGDRVVIPFCLACGECRMCKMELYSCCERSNRNGKEQAKALGYGVAGALGYSHLTGGYAGGQAEYARIRSQTSGRSSCRTAIPMSRSCFCRTSSRPAIWKEVLA